MKMKPLPRLLLIIATVGGVSYGFHFARESGALNLGQASTAAVASPAPMETAPLSPMQSSAAIDVPQAPAAAPSVPVALSVEGANAGLNKLLNAGSKK